GGQVGSCSRSLVSWIDHIPANRTSSFSVRQDRDHEHHCHDAREERDACDGRRSGAPWRTESCGGRPPVERAEYYDSAAPEQKGNGCSKLPLTPGKRRQDWKQGDSYG